MFRQGQLAVHGLAILLGRNEAGISNRGKTFLHHAVYGDCPTLSDGRMEHGMLCTPTWWLTKCSPRGRSLRSSCRPSFSLELAIGCHAVCSPPNCGPSLPLPVPSRRVVGTQQLKGGKQYQILKRWPQGRQPQRSVNNKRE